MNRLQLTAAMVLVVGMVSGVLAEKADNAKLIVGNWEVTKADEGALPVGTVLVFDKDGKVKITAKSGDKTSTAEGTYSVAGDKLSVTLKHGDKEVKHAITIKKLSATEYISENEKGKKAEYKRK